MTFCTPAVVGDGRRCVCLACGLIAFSRSPAGRTWHACQPTGVGTWIAKFLAGVGVRKWQCCKCEERQKSLDDAGWRLAGWIRTGRRNLKRWLVG